MHYLIGVDEAGLGPNLGPLVVAASVFQVDQGISPWDLEGHLAPWVASQSTRASSSRLWIADSKVVYQGGKGWESLRETVEACLEHCGISSKECLTKGLPLCPVYPADPHRVPWYRELPSEVCLDDAGRGARVGHRPTQRSVDSNLSGFPLRALRSAIVTEPRFNLLLDRLGSKGALLGHVTMKLLRRVLSDLGPGTAVVTCDRHGGRKHYGPLVQHFFPDQWLRVIEETPTSSRYQAHQEDRRIEMEFVVRGERAVGVALGSMLAKYLRELAMQRLNAFWRRFLPDLVPTAGYPLDARRFWERIHFTASELRIPRHWLWRAR